MEQTSHTSTISIISNIYLSFASSQEVVLVHQQLFTADVVRIFLLEIFADDSHFGLSHNFSLSKPIKSGGAPKATHEPRLQFEYAMYWVINQPWTAVVGFTL